MLFSWLMPVWLMMSVRVGKSNIGLAHGFYASFWNLVQRLVKDPVHLSTTLINIYATENHFNATGHYRSSL
jgi:hypothetical protein